MHKVKLCSLGNCNRKSQEILVYNHQASNSEKDNKKCWLGCEEIRTFTNCWWGFQIV